MSTINLLPGDFLKGRLQRRANILCVVMLSVVMTGIVCAALMLERTTRHTLAVDRRVQKEYENAARLIEQMRQLESERQKLYQKALATAPLMERVPRSTLLGVVTNSLPPHASLVSFELETKKRPMNLNGAAGLGGAKRASKFAKVASQRLIDTSPSIVKLRITGLASTDVEVAKFIANMARSPLMASVDLVYSQEKKQQKQDRPVRQFQVLAELDQGVDAVEVVGNKQAAADHARSLLAKASPGDEK